MERTSTTPQVSVEQMRQELQLVFDPFEDQSFIRLHDVVLRFKDKEIRTLYEQGYSSNEFLEALAHYFSGEVLDPAIDRERLLRNEEFTDKQRVRIGLFRTVSKLAPKYTALEVADFLRECSGAHPVFPSIDLAELNTKYSFSLKSLCELGKLNLDCSGPFSKLKACLSIFEEGGSTELVKELQTLKDVHGGDVFRNIWQFVGFIGEKGTFEIAQQLLSLRNSDQEPLFQTARTLVSALTHRNSNAELFDALVHSTNDYDEPLFRYGEEINDYMGQNGGLRRAKHLSSLRSPSGERAFTGYEIALMKEAAVNVRECASWAAEGKDVLEQIYCKRLGIKSPDFRNDGRPKALVFVPGNDSSSLGVRVFLEASEGFYRTIVGSYDLCLRAMSNRYQLYEGLHTFASECQLISISGHGSPEAIAISYDTSRYNSQLTAEAFEVKKDDPLLYDALSSMPPESVLFLDSCSTARQRDLNELGNHFAGSLSKHLPHIRVIASKTPFSPDEVVIDNVVPFRAKIFSHFQEATFSSFNGEWSGPERNQYDVQNAISARGEERLTSLPEHFVKGPLRKSRFCKDLTAIEAAISRASYPYAYPEEMLSEADKVQEIPGIEVIERRDPYREREQKDWQYLFGELLGKPWCPAFGTTYGSEASAISNNPVYFLRRHGYQLVEAPELGDIVLYLKRDSDFVKEGQHVLTYASHHLFGLYVDKRTVVSKPHRMHVLRHPDNLIPLSDETDSKKHYFRLFFREE